MADAPEAGSPTPPAPAPIPGEQPAGSPPGGEPDGGGTASSDPFAVRPGARPHPDDSRPARPRGRGEPGGPPSPPEPRRAASPPRRPVEIEAARPLIRRIRITGLISSVAVLLAVLLPPIGAALGLLGAVRSIRVRPAVIAAGLRPSITVVPLVSGIVAVTVGVLATVVAVALGPELLDLNHCLQAANTHTAQGNCQDAFDAALAGRLS